MINIKDTVLRLVNTKKISEKLLVGSGYSFHKVDENFVTTFIEVKLVGKALIKYQKALTEKEPFVVTEGIIRNEPYKDVQKLVMTIFDIKRYEKKEKSDLTPVDEEDIPF